MEAAAGSASMDGVWRREERKDPMVGFGFGMLGNLVSSVHPFDTKIPVLETQERQEGPRLLRRPTAVQYSRRSKKNSARSGAVAEFKLLKGAQKRFCN